MLFALTPPNKSKRGRNRALRVIMFICSPRRRRDGRTINACLCSSESLLLLARVVLVLAALMLPCSLIILLPQVCHFLSHFFYPKFWISLQPQRQPPISLRLMTSIEIVDHNIIIESSFFHINQSVVLIIKRRRIDLLMSSRGCLHNSPTINTAHNSNLIQN